MLNCSLSFSISFFVISLQSINDKCHTLLKFLVFYPCGMLVTLTNCNLYYPYCAKEDFCLISPEVMSVFLINICC